jgi:DNA polymerase III sliding clamp (beta) subunit (PCNA family)
MIVAFKRKELLDELEWLAGVIDSRSAAWPLLSCVLIEMVEEGPILLYATDADLVARSEMPGPCNATGKMAIRLKQLVEIVRLAQGSIAIEKLETRARITSDSASWTIAIENEADFPRVDLEDVEPAVSIPGVSLALGLRKINWADFDTWVSGHGHFAPIVHLVVDKEAASWSLAGLTSHGMGYVLNSCWAKQDLRAALSKKAAKAIVSMGDQAVELAAKDMNILATRGHRTLRTRTVDQAVPQYLKELQRPVTSSFTVYKDALIGMIRRVSVALETGKIGMAHRAIRMDLSAAELKLSVQGDIRQASETMEIECSGEEAAMAFRPEYVLEALATVGTEKALVEVFGEAAGLFIKPVEGGDLEHVAAIMGVRL